MKRNDLVDSIGKIDDDMVETVDTLRTAKKEKRPWMMWGALAACLCLILAGTFIIYPNYSNEIPGTQDIEPAVDLCLEDVLADDMFGVYFPTEILPSYQFETAAIYDGVILGASFIGNEDSFSIRIATKDLWLRQGKTDFVSVDDLESTNSNQVYIDCGEYGVFYSFNNQNLSINTINGFYEMVCSAEYFK